MRYACPVRREGQSPPLSLPLFLAQGFNPGNRPPGRRALTRNMVELRVTLAVEIGR